MLVLQTDQSIAYSYSTCFRFLFYIGLKALHLPIINMHYIIRRGGKVFIFAFLISFFFSYIRIEKINFNSEFNRFIIIFYPLPQYALYNPPRLKSFHICYIWIQTATLKKLFKTDFPNRNCNVIYYWKCSGSFLEKLQIVAVLFFLLPK